MAATRAAAGRTRASLLLALCGALAACSTLNGVGQTFLGGGVNGPGSGRRLTGFVGGAVADEPTAAVAGRDVLIAGGNAADAAVAVGFTLAVTYPSRASLGAGGACLVYNPSRDGPGGGAPEAILFTPIASAGLPGARTDRPAAVPMLARGLFALHARYGQQPFDSLITPPEQLARFGTPASRAFVRDLQLVAGPLMADPDARRVFAPNGAPLGEGSQLVQTDLGSTLAQLRVAGVGDLYQGALARKFESASAIAGGGVSAASLRAALPKTAAPLLVRRENDQIAFLPPPADGGLAAAVAMRALLGGADAASANAAGLAAAARWRAGGVDPAALLAAPPAPGGASLPALPASTTFATLDRNGNAVVCAVTMNNLFGTGRIAPGTGIVMAASPGSVPQPLLAAGLAWNPNLRAFHAEVGGSGQEGAPIAVAAGLQNALTSHVAMAAPVPEPGRANVVQCARYLPDSEGSCGWAADPRGAGLAVGADR